MPPMAKVIAGRQQAVIEGDFVVFLIGARPDLRHPLRTFAELGGRRGMTYMLAELSKDPGSGLLGFQMGFPVIVQYWRSFEHLEAFARDDNRAHRPAWRNYWKRVANGTGAGIWHETYLVRAGEYEAVYANMPPVGLGKASGLVPAGRDSTARARLRAPARG
jgi:Domain of unknown function (DUF4188)